MEFGEAVGAVVPARSGWHTRANLIQDRRTRGEQRYERMGPRS